MHSIQKWSDKADPLTMNVDTDAYKKSTTSESSSLQKGNRNDITQTMTLVACDWVLQTITDYKWKPSHELPSDTKLPNELNVLFYACLQEYNTVTYVEKKKKN